MPRMSVWNVQRKNNYKTVDNYVRQQYVFGGTSAYIHKYLGPKDNGDAGGVFPDNSDPALRQKGDLSQPNYLEEKPASTETDIQDLFYLENRDRKYDPDIYELRCHYPIQDNDFDLRQFGLFLTSDNLYITVHYNDMVDKIGRAIMPGDVIELPHLRQEQLDPNLPNINKYYVVEDANRASEGYAPTWYNHIWRLRVGPVNNQQEYSDILEQKAKNFYGEETENTLADVISTLPNDIKIVEAVDGEADRQVHRRKFVHEHLYILPCLDQNGNPIPRNKNDTTICLAYGDGKPPNGATLVGSGNRYPDDPQEGDYFLRTDYSPNVLFVRRNGGWRREEVDWRSRWSAANDVLRRFINYEGKLDYQYTGTKINKRQYLSKVLSPDIKGTDKN